MALFAIGIIGSSTVAQAGPWTQERNHFYLQIGTAYTHASEFWDQDNNKQQIKVLARAGDLSARNSNLEQLLSDLYFEYGVLNSLTLFGNFPFLNSLRQSNPGDGNLRYVATNVGDLMLGTRIGILVKPLVFALEARLTFPTGDVNAIIPTGTGDFRGELRLVAGKSLKSVPLSFIGEVGFTERGYTKFKSIIVPTGSSVDYSPEFYIGGSITLNLAFHKTAMERLLIIASADYRTSMNAPDAIDSSLTLIPSTSQLATVQGQVMWFFWKYMGLSVRYARAVYGARVPITDTVGGAIFANY
jgi:hypothetical protein